MTIHVLADDVISKIAAGEVIERPSSVVKELIENAIDAAASEIRIRIDGAGKRLIEISDDGCGIANEELRFAVTRHATSKLRVADDLFRLGTLGFRGEALASAASVSRLTIVSRTASEPVGSRIQVDGARLVSQQPAAAPRGTTVRVEDLFYNVPARLKFLKSDRTELSQISTLITRYALAYPQIRWELTVEGRTQLQSAGNGETREILSAVYDLDIAKRLIEIEEERDGIAVSGYISPIALTRSNRREINFFVNGRWIQDQQLVAAVNRAYQSLIMVGRYPITILFLKLSPEEVDVNVHPSKAEVRFRSAETVFSAVHHAVRKGLQLQAPIPEARPTLGWAAAQQLAPFDASAWDAPERPAWREGYSEPASNAEPAIAVQPPSMPEGGVPPVSYETPSFIPPHTDRSGAVFPLLRWIGQIGNTYVLAEGPDGLYLIDQHAAHERILFEKCMRRPEAELISIPLLEPAIIRLQPHEVALLEEHRGILTSLGFEIEAFGPVDFRVYAIPEIFSKGNPAAAVRSLVEDFEEDETPLMNVVAERIAARVCKRMAVKAGQPLSEAEQKQLIRELEDCESPRTCPHGRPTMIHLRFQNLEQQFGRKGKL